jgi:hypothetical protein
MNKKNNISIKYIILLCMMISFSYKSFGTIIINNLTIWSTPTDITQEIIIERDGFLLITANTRFNSNCFIQVEEGGTLIVENCTLSHNPNDIGVNQLWIGIIVIGQSNLPQKPQSNQGFVYLNNATISDANCAIMAGGNKIQQSIGGIYYSSYDGGGIIKAVNCQFINNLKTLQLENYAFKNNLSCFKIVILSLIQMHPLIIQMMMIKYLYVLSRVYVFKGVIFLIIKIVDLVELFILIKLDFY